MSGAYYNEFDPQAAAWLRELISRGLIADGDVDERSILDVQPDDLHGYTQCHFFAGIGGWSYALRLAGVTDDEPVWTGSPPCQPFSSAGRREGKDDDRHLAPHFVDLVRSTRPGLLFGEQVASADVFGKAASTSRRNASAPPQWAWLDDLSNRLEAAHYAVGASDIPAAGIGAPHIRQRTFFGAVRVADSNHEGLEGYGQPGRLDGPQGWKIAERHAATDDVDGRLAHTERRSAERYRQQVGGETGQDTCREEERKRVRDDLWYGVHDCRTNAPDGFWSNADWIGCRDGKWRPIEPGTSPLAHGVSAGMGRLRGYGNAIVPQAAAEFVKAFREAILQP